MVDWIPGQVDSFDSKEVRPMAEWISIKDQLPPKDKDILAAYNDGEGWRGPFLGEWCGGWNDPKTALVIEVGEDDWMPCTHWMSVELPQGLAGSELRASCSTGWTLFGGRFFEGDDDGDDRQ